MICQIEATVPYFLKNCTTFRLISLQVFLGMKKTCRRKTILEHFGETFSPPKAGDFSRLCCDNCCATQILPSGSCQGPAEDDEVDFSADARMFLQCVSECGTSFGLGVPVSVLRGASDSKRPYLASKPSWGKGKHASKDYWMALGRSLVASDMLGQTVKQMGNSGYRSVSYTTVYVAAKGSTFLADQSQVFKLGKYRMKDFLKCVLMRLSCFFQVPTKELRKDRKSSSGKDFPRVSSYSTTSLVNISPKERLTNELFRNLLQLRARLAAKQNLAPYMIFAEDTLRQLAVRMEET